jgi:hypothetical protein
MAFLVVQSLFSNYTVFFHTGITNVAAVFVPSKRGNFSHMTSQKFRKIMDNTQVRTDNILLAFQVLPKSAFEK